jgi:DNA-binding transcriptional LysR family regulator
VRRSIGIGLTRAFTYHLAPFLGTGALTTVLDAFRSPSLPVSFVYAGGRFLPMKLRAFLDFATPRLKDRLAQL